MMDSSTSSSSSSSVPTSNSQSDGESLRMTMVQPSPTTNSIPLPLLITPSPSVTPSSSSSSSSSTAMVRSALVTDSIVAAAVLQKAFANDPVFDYLCRNDEYRGIAINNLFTTTFYQSFRHNLAYVVTHPSQSMNIAGVALWYPPHTGAVVSTYGTWITFAGLWKLLRIALTGIRIELAHPKEPCYYLFAVGIDPLAQGMKLAGKLLREHLTKADNENIPCYLENSNPKNTPVYEHLGFRKLIDIHLGSNAPPLTAMWRKVGGGN